MFLSRPLYTGDFCRGNSMQFLSRQNCIKFQTCSKSLRYRGDKSLVYTCDFEVATLNATKIASGCCDKNRLCTRAFRSRPPCLCPSGGVSIQSSINLGDRLLRIAREWKTAEAWFLATLFILQSSIISLILEFIYWGVTILVLIIWLVKTENIGAIPPDSWSSFDKDIFFDS